MVFLMGQPRRRSESVSAAMGEPGMEQITVAGNLEHGWPELAKMEVSEVIARNSPAARIADAAGAGNLAVEVGVEIPIFNRNQGNVAAARAEGDRAEEEKHRIALTLRERAASVLDQYSSAGLIVEQNRKEILPRIR